MKLHISRLSLLALALILLLFGGVAAQEPQATTNLYLPLAIAPEKTETSSPPPSLNEIQAEVVRLVNAERAKVGCPIATAHPALMSAAQEWSEYMNTNQVFDHSPMDWYTSHGYANGAAENINMGASSVSDVVTTWMNSAPHKRTILSCPDTALAVYDLGVGFSNYRWTLALGSR